MDSGRGNFAEISEKRARDLKEKGIAGIFSIGEQLVLHGSKFKIDNISSSHLSLKLLPDEEPDRKP